MFLKAQDGVLSAPAVARYGKLLMVRQICGRLCAWQLYMWLPVRAGLNGVRLGPSLNVPNGSLGSFGAVTPTETPFESRKQLFDVAASGPLAGFAVSLALFAYGLQVRPRIRYVLCVLRPT